MSGRAWRLSALGALIAGLLMLAPAAQGRGAVTVVIDVTFSPTGTITVTLPDGTPLGSTSGAPMVIPAGYYTLEMSGPGACTQLPLFELKGPGEDIFEDMTGGELDSTSIVAHFLPNSTYTWRNHSIPGIVHTFVTSANVEGTAPVSVPVISSDSHSSVSSNDLVGSRIAAFRGTLTGAVTAAGRLTLAYKGRSVTRLAAGRYTIVVTDKSASSGFILLKIKHAAVRVTGAAFLGKRSIPVNLTAGKWFFMPRLGKATYSIVVH